MFFYDLRSSKLGSLLLKQHLDSDLDVDENYARIEILANQDESDIKVYFFTDEETMLIYNLRYQNEI